MRIGIATAAALPARFDDDRRLIDALTARGAEAVHAVWDDPAVAWNGFDKVIIRTTWDYPHKHAAFLAWADAVDGRLENPARVVRWNSDKHHLADLIAAGVPTVPTIFVEPAGALPSLEDAGLVRTERSGRYKFHYLDTTPLHEIAERWPLPRKEQDR